MQRCTSDGVNSGAKPFPKKLATRFIGYGESSADRVQADISRTIASSVIYPITGNNMEYSELMKVSTLKPIWERGLG
jgi:hypothetical protein